MCQLAREEEIERKKSFYRVGAPDSGVEAYCILNNGNEYGWQAKFFDSMSDSQWRQLEDSFKTALEKHPNLVKYFICTPLDRQDPRIEKQKWFMDKWNEKIAEWVRFAKSKGREIEFEYWGSSELVDRLSLKKHEGRRYFWFNKEEFTDEWFSEKLDRSIDSLGNRYTPELNFALDIAKTFDGIARDAGFKKQFVKWYDELLKKSSNAINGLRDERLKEIREGIQNCLQKIQDEFDKIDFEEIQPINFKTNLQNCEDLRKNISKGLNKLYDLREKEKDQKKAGHDEFGYAIYHVRQFADSLDFFIEFLTSETVALSNLPVLILDGEAGMGKSHLLADIVVKRREKGQPSLLLLGQHFVSDENPWAQILKKQLLLNCTESEFLGALEAKAQSIGSRIVIFIDAINEGRGRYFWPDHIKSFIKSFEKYKWLGIVISVRSSYIKLLVSMETITDDTAVRLTHHGFAGVEYEASKKFFENYNIEQPSVPLLHPEFQNPLFLKLFCDGLKKAGHTRVPDGYEGISKIIKFYMEAINKRLCEPKRLDYPESINLVAKAAKIIAYKMQESDNRYILYEEAYNILETEISKYSSKRHLLAELISEGLFSKNFFWIRHNDSVEGIYLAYERFWDHLITEFILDKHLDSSNPEISFTEGQYLNNFIKDEHACYINKGIVEALSIHLPELIGKELYEVAPHCKEFYPVIESFVKSLILRKTETITDKVLDYVNKYVLKYQDTYELFFDTLLLIASNPDHFFNADSLHRHLMKFSPADRDAGWTIYINDRFTDNTPVKRLIDWAWSEEDKSPYSDETIRLTAKIIAWFLTSSNRFLRDSATKALVSLLENRMPVLIQLLKEFEGVNDPYVYERLYAVAYGCAVRTEDRQNLKDLGLYIYETIFKKEHVYPHMLLRDYARGVIAYALYLKLDISVDVKSIRPPYKSEWPNAIPSDEEIKKYEFDYKSKDFKDYYWGQDSIIMSMATGYGGGMYGDFGRYVFQSGFSDWPDLDPQGLSNLAIMRVFDLGYDVEKHGKFDRRLTSHGREGRKVERIGKKYQWIAFHELLAKGSDNFLMKDPAAPWKEKRLIQCEGPWEPYVRDIDPTMLIKKTMRGNYDNNSHWWYKESYNDWEDSNPEWLAKHKPLPEPVHLISVKDASNVDWLTLKSYLKWEEPDKIGKEKYDYPHKSLWYQIRSYLVSKDEFKSIVGWAKRQNFMGLRMPQAGDRYELFSREYFWSPAFEFFKKSYYDGEVWRKLNDPETKKCIGKVMVTTESFLWDEEYDCSKEHAIYYLKPCEALLKGLRMKFGKAEGELLNQSNEMICFDPSVGYGGPSCLLIRKNDLLEHLKKEDLRIVWTVLGEKQISGGFLQRTTDAIKWLEISGAYYLNDRNEIVGSLNFWQK